MLHFLYETIPGRMFLKVLTRPSLSMAVGRYLDSPLSKWLIPIFIWKNHIDMSQYEKEKYTCFNDCFCRQIKADMRPVDMDPEAFIAPCDGLLSIYPIQGDLVLPVKQSMYRIEDLLLDQELAEKYKDGTCLVFRLCVNHYHRYCYPDYGTKTGNQFIPGVLHTVQPIALRKRPVFVENSRECTILHSENFGDILQMEVGAMLVGKIQNYHFGQEVEKGQEKGRFLYGGSTIILLLEKDRVKFAPKLYRKTQKEEEVPVRLGQRIGIKIR